MIIGDFTKKPPKREVYSVEFDPSKLNRAQRRAYIAYLQHENALEMCHLRAQFRRQLRKAERLRAKAARQQQESAETVIPDNEQTGEASITGNP